MSINLVIIGPNRIVAIGDSRTTHRGAGGVVTSTSDDGPQKLFQAGRYSVCGCIGVTHAGSIRLKERLEMLASDPSFADQPRKLLEAFRENIAGPLTANFSPEWDRQGATIHLTAFALTRHPAGDLDLWELRFPLSDRKLGEPELVQHRKGMPDFPPNTPLCYCRPVSPIMMMRTFIKTDGSDADICRDVDFVFKHMAGNNEAFRLAVSMASDIAAIDSDGFRWLRSRGRRPLDAAMPTVDSGASTNVLDWGNDARYKITGSLTWWSWIKIGDPTTAATIAYQGHDTNGSADHNDLFNLSVTPDGNGTFSVVYNHESGTAVANSHTFAAALKAGTWYFLFVVRDDAAKTVKLYIGSGSSLTLFDTFTYSNSPSGGQSSGTRLTVGNAQPTNVCFNGTIEEHGLWNRTATQAEGEAAMGGNPSFTSLVLGSNMGDDPEVDFSENGGSGTVTGTTLVQGHS